MTSDSSSDAAVGWPVLATQAGRDGYREVMIPANLGRDLLRAILGGLMTAAEEGATQVKAVRVAAVDGHTLTLVSRRTRATSDGTAHAWALGSEPTPMALTGHTGHITGVAVSPDGRIAATAGWDHTLRTWETVTGRTLALVTDQQSRFSGCALTPDGRTVAATAFDGTVTRHDALTGEPGLRIRLPVNLPGAIAVGAEGAVVYAGARDGTVRRVDAAGDELSPLDGHHAPVTALAVSPTGYRLASAARDGAVLVWDVGPDTRATGLPGHPGGATACAFLTDDRLLTAGWDGRVLLWDLTTITPIVVWSDPAPIRALAVAAAAVAVSTQPGTITLIDPTGTNEPLRLTTAPGPVITLAATQDPPLLITGSIDDVPGGVPVRDGFGRPATFTEGLLVPTAGVTDLPPAVWHRIHAESLTAMALAAADPTGRTLVAALPLPLPPTLR
ncbi:WD40 repeat domain-containing protein [Dactylosporangium sp. CA-139114]|uniref:WD40 repeat domain-containing protein n=1 Tax=Dactylosporangium sp. CA-139114 TaxID=3239931 RepID=UPI003D97F7D4